MAKQFQLALLSAKDRQSLVDDQRRWVAQRDSACAAVSGPAAATCFIEMTKSRATALIALVPTNADAKQSTLPPTAPSPSKLPRSETPIAEAKSNPPAQSQQIAPSSPPSTSDPPMLLYAALAVLAFIAFRIVRKALRRRWLTKKYGAAIADMIIAGKVWQDMTEEQLVESWGKPIEVGQEIIRARVKETWKYNRTGKNRFANRIYLENGVVIGWKT